MRITFRTFVCDEDHRWSTPNPRKIPKLVHIGMYIGIVSGLILSTVQKNQNTMPMLARYKNLCLRMVSETSGFLGIHLFLHHKCYGWFHVQEDECCQGYDPSQIRPVIDQFHVAGYMLESCLRKVLPIPTSLLCSHAHNDRHHPEDPHQSEHKPTKGVFLQQCLSGRNIFSRHTD